MAEKMTKRKQQALETRSRILKSALKLFEENGYNNVSIQDIAETSQASVGSIYHYFRSKEEMAVQVTEFLDERYASYYECLMTEKEYADIDVLQKLFLFYVFVQKENCQYENIKNLYVYSLKNPNRNQLSMTDSRELLQIYREMLKRCREAGVLRDTISNEEIIDLLLQSSRGLIVDWLIREKNFDMEQQAKRWGNIIIQTIRKKEDDE